MQANGPEPSLKLILASLMLAASVFILAKIGIWLTQEAGRVAALWLANAAILAALLRSPRRHWSTLLGAAALANIAANLCSGDPIMRAMALSLANVVEVSVASLIVVGRLDRRASFDDSKVIMRFLGAAGLVAPFCSAIIAASYLFLADGAALLPTFANWWIADALGLLTLTPLLLSVELHDEMASPDIDDVASDLLIRSFKAILFAGTSACLVAYAFYQSAAPLLFLIAPILVFSALRQSLGAAMLTLAVSALVVTGLTISGHGPLRPMAADPVWRSYVLQSYIAAMIFLVLPVRALVSERNRLAIEIQQNDRRWAGIAETWPAGILQLDDHCRPIWANQKWQHLSGHAAAELDRDEWLRAVHPLDGARARSLMTSVRAIHRTRVDQFRMAPHLGDGWFELAIHPHYDGNQCLGYFVCLTDISDRKAIEAALLESEKRYRLVTENTRDMVFRIGLDGAALYVSSAVRRVIGHEPGDLLGKPLDGIVHQNDWPRFAINFSDLLAGGGEAEMCLRLRCKNGKYLWVDTSFQLVLTDLGEPIELIACVRETQAVGNSKEGSNVAIGSANEAGASENAAALLVSAIERHRSRKARSASG